jgi:4-hydroxybenzoate polyprenyltransferase/phosphoserine phosphatase
MGIGRLDATDLDPRPPGMSPDPTSKPHRPLVVDLDGTLVATDLLIEAALFELSRDPAAFLDMSRSLVRGRASVKEVFASREGFDPAKLPYDPEVLGVIREAKLEGRPIYLASAANERLVKEVADHLGLFDGWFGSTPRVNLSGHSKAQKLVEAFGEKGFDYIGNSAADLPVWRRAASAIEIRTPARVVRRLTRSGAEVRRLTCAKPTWRTWARLMRVHQYAKNGLVFVPLLTAHLFDAASILKVLLAALAFSLCASAVYIFNDLCDLRDDRSHAYKRNRPLASGAIPLAHGVAAVPLLLVSSALIGTAVTSTFLMVLAAYLVVTTAYTLVLKKLMLVDVIALGGLYTLRVIAGAAALSVPVSPWLLAFCLMVFSSLALLKRYVELAACRDGNLPDPTSRNYRASDLEMIGALAAAAGFNALTVFALYVSSEAVHRLYATPELLWLVGVLLMYWLGRALLLASRRQLHDDPVVFALKDPVSLCTIGASAILVVLAV